MVVSAGPNASGRADASTSIDTTTNTDTGTATDARTDTHTDASAVESGARCPVCDAAFDSVSVHETGLMVNLIGNERYQRVCLEPVNENGPRIRFYHHTHEQTALPE